jgi:hypothetical protein
LVNLRGDGVGWRRSSVAMEGQGVDDQRVGEHVEVLAEMADGVGATQPESVVERSVDALSVVAPPVQTREVGALRRSCRGSSVTNSPLCVPRIRIHIYLPIGAVNWTYARHPSVSDDKLGG